MGGQSFKKWKKARFIPRKLALYVLETDRFIRMTLNDAKGKRTLHNSRFFKNLNSNYLFEDGVEPALVGDAIDKGLLRLENLLIIGGYGWVYGNWYDPERFGYYDASVSLQIDLANLDLNTWLAPKYRERLDLTKYDSRLNKILDDGGIFAVGRMAYINFQRDVFRIRRDYDKSLWSQKIYELRNEGINPILDQNILDEIEILIVPEIH